MEELKRCPFCGRIPSAGFRYYSGNTYDYMFFAAVVRCACGIEKSKIFKATDISLVSLCDYEDAIKEAIGMWNERVE